MEKRTSYVTSEFQTREEEGKLIISGYPIVFNQRTELWKGFYEEIAPEAVKSFKGVKVLWNHNRDLVMASVDNGTARCKVDEHGVYTEFEVNPHDSDAVNGYQRVKRGDVKGWSFGFAINKHEERMQDDGTYLDRVTDIDLFEVSPCVFPAYPQTEINARKRAFEKRQDQDNDIKQKALRERVKEILNGGKAINQSEQNQES